MAVKQKEDEGLSLTQNWRVNSVISVIYGAVIIVWPEWLGRTIGLYLLVTGFLNLLQRRH